MSEFKESKKEYFAREILPKSWKELPPAIKVIFDEMEKRINALEDKIKALEDKKKSLDWIKEY